VTSTDQHYAAPANVAELLGATHAWRSMLRQAAAQLDMIATHAATAADRPTQRALQDVVTDLNQACALLTTLDTTLDPAAAVQRREQCRAQLAERARTPDIDPAP
jgi:hypothetical protein